jgi:hypothetical protein
MKARCHGITLSLLVLFFLSAVPSRAATLDESIPDPQFIAQLESRALQAKPREQCFLYAEIVHSMTRLAGKQFLDGDVEEASATLKKIEHYAQLIHQQLANDTRRVKDAEMLMQHTTVHMGEAMHRASGDDRAELQATLKHLDHVHDELLAQVFNH